MVLMRNRSYKARQKLVVKGMLAVMASVLGFTAPADAQILSFALVNPSQTGNPGDTLTYRGIFSNLLPNENVYISGLSLDNGNLLDGTFTVDTSLFFTNLEANLVYDPNTFAYYIPGGQSRTFDIFTVSLPANAQPGTVRSSTVNIQGGGPNQSDELAQALATAGVLQPVPAPPSWLSLPLGAGIAGVMGVVRRRRSKGLPTRSAAG